MKVLQNDANSLIVRFLVQNPSVVHRDLNRTIFFQIPQNWSKLVEAELTHVSPGATVESTQFEKETCFVGALTTISGKTSIKSSSFGTGCVVKPKARISECIIMNNVQVNEG